MQLIGDIIDWRAVGHVHLCGPGYQVSDESVFALSPLTIHFGSLELIVWLVPSLVGDAVAVSIIGLLLGPMYPIAMNHAGRVLPHWLLTGKSYAV